MSSSTSNAKPSIPPTRAIHKRRIFDTIQQLLSVSVSYTLMWGDKAQGVQEQDFLDWVEDVLKSLPMTEKSIPEAMVLMVGRIMKRTSEYEVKIIEHIDGSRDAPSPAVMEREDGTSEPIKQIKKPVLPRLPHGAGYEFGGNTARFLPTTNPMVVTFTPDPSENPDIPLEPAMTFEVLPTGEIAEHVDSYCPVEQPPPTLPKSSTSSNPALPSTLSQSRAVQTETDKASCDDHTFWFTAPAKTRISPGRKDKQIGDVFLKGRVFADIPSPSPVSRQPKKPKRVKNTASTSASSAKPAVNLVPFPTMDPPIAPAILPLATPLTRETTKSSVTKKPTRQSARVMRSRNSNASASSSAITALPAIQTITRPTSLRKGKKRAREVEVEEEEEATRPTRRLRSDSVKSDSKLSHKVSGMKNAVLKFATGVFKS